MKKRPKFTNTCATECQPQTPDQVMESADFTTWPIDSLLSAHKETYRAMSPTIREYTRLGKRIVDLHKEIFLRRAKEFCPLAIVRDLPFVCKISMHDKLESIEELWKQLDAKQAHVTEITFDPVRNEFHLYGSLAKQPS